jgi:serine/threonine protein kinase
MMDQLRGRLGLRGGGEGDEAARVVHRVVGDYQLAGKLGKGASGVVFKAIHRLYGNIVAIKTISTAGISKEEVANIEMEIKLLKELDHPNIIKYIDSQHSAGALNIVLEYAEGGSLAKMMQQIEPGCLPASLVAIYMPQILNGLVYLHDQGVVHRDIKAANILVGSSGEVRLADFGVAIRQSLGEQVQGGCAVIFHCHVLSLQEFSI